MRNKVSIIISLYNIDITRALESCLNQSYKNIEIIVVDDYSTKDTNIGAFLDAPNVLLVKHDTNKGAGEARKTGLKYVTGDYTLFLDSDDYLKQDYIETLLNHAISDNVDIVVPGIIYKEGEYERVVTPDSKIQVGAAKYSPEKDNIKRFMNTMLIKSKLWENVEYCNRRYIEDTPTLFKILYYANSIKCIEYAGYYYVTNPNSLTHTASRCKHDVFRCLAILDIYNFTKDKPVFANTKDVVIQEFQKLLNVYPKQELDKYKKEIKELKKALIKLQKD